MLLLILLAVYLSGVFFTVRLCKYFSLHKVGWGNNPEIVFAPFSWLGFISIFVTEFLVFKTVFKK